MNDQYPFHMTPMGQTFYEDDVPEITLQLARIADSLETLVELQESNSEQLTTDGETGGGK